MSKSRSLMVWLYFFHYNYISDEVGVRLEALNVNDHADQDEIIKLVLEKELENAPDNVRNQMRDALDNLDLYSEAEVRGMIEEVGMPFEEPLRDYRQFFGRIRSCFFSWLHEKWNDFIC